MNGDLKPYVELLSSFDKGLIHQVRDEGDLVKIFTSFLLGESMDYLTLYLFEEDGEVYLTDANNIYMIMDDYYSIDPHSLEGIALEVGLSFDDCRFYQQTSLETLKEDLIRFGMAIEGVIELERR